MFVEILHTKRSEEQCISGRREVVLRMDIWYLCSHGDKINIYLAALHTIVFSSKQILVYGIVITNKLKEA